MMTKNESTYILIQWHLSNYIYIYIYRERERERDENKRAFMVVIT